MLLSEQKYIYMYISVLNGALWDMEQVHAGICEIGLFTLFSRVRGTRIVVIKKCYYDNTPFVVVDNETIIP